MSADAIAQLLGEIGIQVDVQELRRDLHEQLPPIPSSEARKDPAEPPAYEYWEPADSLPSFVHLTHLTRERPSNPYSRTTYFGRLVDQLCGRLSVNVDATDKIILRRLRRLKGLAEREEGYFIVRALLRKWGFTSDRYRKIWSYLRALGGKVLRCDTTAEYAMRDDFARLSAAFNRLAPDVGRHNFPSYPVVIQALLYRYHQTTFYTLPTVKARSRLDQLICMYLRLRVDGGE